MVLSAPVTKTIRAKSKGGVLKALLDPETMVYKKEPFLFLLEMEINRAIRYQNYISLLLVEAESAIEDKGVRESIRVLASILLGEVRKTDIVGKLDKNRLSVILLNADRSASYFVKERLASILANYGFPSFLSAGIKFALACFPSDSTDARNLLKRALDQLQGI